MEDRGERMEDGGERMEDREDRGWRIERIEDGETLPHDHHAAIGNPTSSLLSPRRGRHSVAQGVNPGFSVGARHNGSSPTHPPRYDHAVTSTSMTSRCDVRLDALPADTCTVARLLGEKREEAPRDRERRAPAGGRGCGIGLHRAAVLPSAEGAERRVQGAVGMGVRIHLFILWELVFGQDTVACAVRATTVPAASTRRSRR